MLTVNEIRTRVEGVPGFSGVILENRSPPWCPALFVYRPAAARRFNEWGRGLSKSAAQLGALMERVERVSAYLAADSAPIRRMKSSETRSALTLGDLGYCNFQVFERLDEREPREPNEFVDVKRLSDGEEFVAPASRVFLRKAGLIRDASCSTGLAAGFSVDDAIARGFMEVVERHFHHLYRFGQLPVTTGMDVGKFTAPYLRVLSSQLKCIGLSATARCLKVADLLNVVFLNLEHKDDAESGISVHAQFHVGVHVSEETAFERALTESLVTRISRGWTPAAWRESFVDVAATTLPANHTTCALSSSGHDWMRRVAEALSIEVYHRNLTIPSLGIPVVRVLVPGLQPNFDLLGYSPLDPRSRITHHLTSYKEWIDRVRLGNMEGAAEARAGPPLPKCERGLNVNRGQATHIRLERSAIPSNVELAIRERRSRREIAGNLTLRDLSTLLVGATCESARRYAPPWGFTSHRGYPSGGGLHDLQMVVEVANCDGLQPGFYLFETAHSSLAQLLAPSEAVACRQTLQEQELQPAVVLRIFRFGSRQRQKYGAMNAARFAALEAGAWAQNIALLATTVGISCLPLGGVQIHLPGEVSAGRTASDVIHCVALGRAQH